MTQVNPDIPSCYWFLAWRKQIESEGAEKNTLLLTLCSVNEIYCKQIRLKKVLKKTNKKLPQ